MSKGAEPVRFRPFAFGEKKELPPHGKPYGGGEGKKGDKYQKIS